jgi:hypothetical protein
MYHPAWACAAHLGNSNPFASYADLAASLTADLNCSGKTILDGEVVNNLSPPNQF